MSDKGSLDRYRALCTRSLTGHGIRDIPQLLAEIPADAGIDRYGSGGAVAALEAEIATTLGKPAAVFMPSGTMAQQIALRVHADRRGCRNVAFHPSCHLEIHEEKAYQRLHGLVGIVAGNRDRLMTRADLEAIAERLAAVLIELPQREIGGQLPSWNELEALAEHVRARGAALHLDGARLWESTPFYSRTPAGISALFDTVYVSFYKGLGALAGCCLAGEKDVIDEARAWRKRHGGMLYGMWPNAASALGALRRRLPLMPRYFEHAVAIARVLRDVRNVEVLPYPPQTPMMFLDLRVADDAFVDRAWRIAKDEGLATWPSTAALLDPALRRVEFTVGDATLDFTPAEVGRVVDRLVN